MNKRKPALKLRGALANPKGTDNDMYHLKLRRHAQRTGDISLGHRIELRATQEALDWMLNLEARGRPPAYLDLVFEKAWERLREKR